MKIRNDYVSNSSSSSFIVIAKEGKDETLDIISKFAGHREEWMAYQIPNDNYKHQFGWEWEDTYSFEGKLNFIGIQLLYLLMMKTNKRKSPWKLKYDGKDFDRLYEMLRKVCKEKFKFCVELNKDVLEADMWKDEKEGWRCSLTMDSDFYIDHQSCSTEGSCMEMFDSEDALYDFLRYEDSYVRGGNDNG